MGNWRARRDHGEATRRGAGMKHHWSGKGRCARLGSAVRAKCAGHTGCPVRCRNDKVQRRNWGSARKGSIIGIARLSQVRRSQQLRGRREDRRRLDPMRCRKARESGLEGDTRRPRVSRDRHKQKRQKQGPGPRGLSWLCPTYRLLCHFSLVALPARLGNGKAIGCLPPEGRSARAT